MPDATPINRPLAHRWLPRPQFSLRLLLLAVTAFAIGFPLWYRGPIEEETLEYPRIQMKLGSKHVPVEDKRAQPIRRTITTWRRSWGKGKVKHGPTTDHYYYSSNEQTRISNYANGERHGPYFYKIQGEARESGQYVHDQKEGKWITSDKHMGMSATVAWHQDQIHGQAEMHFPDGSVERATLDHGLLTHIDDQPIKSPLLERVRRGEITSPLVMKQLQRDMGFAAKSSRGNWLDFAVDMGMDVPILATPAVASLDDPFDGRTLGLNTQSALVLITHRNNLACDYRYGCLWITTPDDAQDWHDPTGVAEVRAKPRSLLAAAWNEPANHWQFDEPLAAALQSIAAPLGINFDTAQVAPTTDGPGRFHVKVYLSINGNYLSLRDLLGLLLYKTRCRCELRGDTLVILPPPEPANEKQN